MTCAKLTVKCTLVRTPKPDDHPHVPITIDGHNYCRRPQKKCPRLPGEGYTKCKTICDQVGHAEEVAILRAQRYAPYFKGSAAYVEGHVYVCATCTKAFNDFGVTDIHLGPPPSLSK